MSDSTSPTITFDLAGVGEVTMTGVGPWRVRDAGTASHIIVDSSKRESNPSVVQAFGKGGTGRKANQNVTFASLDRAQAIVNKANELLAARQAEKPAD